MIKSCGRFVFFASILLTSVVYADTFSALAPAPLAFRRAPKYFFAIALAVIPTVAQNQSTQISLQELMTRPSNPAALRPYLRNVLLQYWKLRLELGTSQVSVTADSLTLNGTKKEEILSLRIKRLEEGIKEILSQLIHTKKDKEDLKIWAKDAHIDIPWNLAPHKLQVSA